MNPQNPTKIEKKKSKVNKNMKLEAKTDSDDEYWRSSRSYGITLGVVETISCLQYQGVEACMAQFEAKWRPGRSNSLECDA